MNVSIDGDGGEDRAGGGGPAHVGHHVGQVDGEEGGWAGPGPDVDGPLGGTADEDVGEEVVPEDPVDRRGVGGEGGDAGGVLGGAEEDTAIVGANEEQVRVVGMEGQVSSTTGQRLGWGLAEVLQLDVRLEEKKVVTVKRGVVKDPAGHSAVKRNGHKVEEAIHIVFCPFNLTNQPKVHWQ